ncbi:replicative DNA helicase, partial [Stomatohabitans albus]
MNNDFGYSEEPSSFRSPPAAIEAENSLLGAIMLNEHVLNDVLPIIRPDDFFRGSNRKIYEAILSLNSDGEPIDPISVIQTLKRTNDLNGVGGDLAVFNLSNEVATSANAEYYARLIADAAAKRRLIDVGGKITEIGFNERLRGNEAVDEAESLVFALANKEQRSDFAVMNTLCADAADTLEHLSQQESGVTGIKSGFYDLDRLTAGFQPGQLIVVAARPAMGKSTLVTNMAQYVAINEKKPVAMFSLEMGDREIMMRLLAAQSGVHNDRLRDPRTLEEQDWTKISRSLGIFAAAPLFIDDTPGINVMEIRAKCRRLHAKTDGLGMVIVDYLQLMESHKATDGRVQEVAEFSRGLKVLAKELEVPVIALSQLSRKPEERENKRPLLSDLRESGAIEQDADIVMFIYRDEVYKQDSQHKGEAELIVAKHRAGQLATINLSFQGHFSRFANLARQAQQGPPPQSANGYNTPPPPTTPTASVA